MALEYNYDKTLGRLTVGDREQDLILDALYENLKSNSKEKQELPNLPDAWNAFPGVDPRGNYHRIDMDFAGRIQKIRNVMPLLAEGNSTIIESFLGSMEEENSRNLFGKLCRDAKEDCKILRDAELVRNMAQKQLEPGHGVISNLAAFVNEMTESPKIKRVEVVLSGLEQIAGIKPGPMEPQVQNLMSRMMPRGEMPPFELDKEAQTNTPRQMQVHFPDFEAMLLQKWYADDQSRWAEPRETMLAQLNKEEGIERLLPDYTKTVVKNALDPLYSTFENQYPADEDTHKRTFIPNSRYSLVIIEGKSIEERLQEEFNKTVPGNQYADKKLYTNWLMENREELGSRMLAEALLNHKHVEAFVPGKDGRLPDMPCRITKEGYQPVPDRPVILNAWERFFSKFGFYKEKVAQAKLYQDTMDARARITENYEMARTVDCFHRPKHDDFFRDFVKENGLGGYSDILKMLPQENGFKIELTKKIMRTSLPSMAVAYMASQGHQIEDIMNPEYLPEEKQKVGKEILKHMAMDPNTGKIDPKNPANNKGDMQWMGKLYWEGQKALRTQFDRITNGVDLTDRSQFMKVHPALHLITHTMQDIIQDTNPCLEEYYIAASKDAPAELWETMVKNGLQGAEVEKGAGKAYADVAGEKLTAIGTAYKKFPSYYTSCLEVGRPLAHEKNSFLMNISAAKMMFQEADRHQGKTFAEKYALDFVSMSQMTEGATRSPLINSLETLVHATRDSWQLVDHYARNDKLMLNYHKGEVNITKNVRGVARTITYEGAAVFDVPTELTAKKAAVNAGPAPRGK